jgi:hypothetical protein
MKKNEKKMKKMKKKIFFLKYGIKVQGKDSLLGRNPHQLPVAHSQNIFLDRASSGG